MQRQKCFDNFAVGRDNENGIKLNEKVHTTYILRNQKRFINIIILVTKEKSVLLIANNLFISISNHFTRFGFEITIISSNKKHYPAATVTVSSFTSFIVAQNKLP